MVLVSLVLFDVFLCIVRVLFSELGFLILVFADATFARGRVHLL